MRVAQEVVQRVLERRMEVEVDVRSIVALLEAPPLLARVLVHRARHCAVSLFDAIRRQEERVRVNVLVVEAAP